ncbi:MAG: 4-hydroxy-tetrahydrodipicolinate reductase [Rhodospirillaceae bacterium]|nr:4-hydroxy-tetrahydrodipicolinate reductase [Rhodospirillaceae bacterium]
MGDCRIAVLGCSGRMGQMLIREIGAAEGCRIGAATELPGNAAVGRDAGAVAGLDPLGVTVVDDAGTAAGASDVLVDFTVPAAAAGHADAAAGTGTALVVGTTGLEPGHTAALEAAAASVPVVYAPNMSLGVNLLFAVTEQVAKALGDDWDVEIVEMHHKHKADAPSGTALGFGRAAARGRGVDLNAVADRGRDGVTGARRQGDIGFAVLRGGDVAGEHSVVFATDSERVEITHKAGSRAIFARGAVRAARWAAGRAPGLYDMADVLGLR